MTVNRDDEEYEPVPVRWEPLAWTFLFGVTVGAVVAILLTAK